MNQAEFAVNFFVALFALIDPVGNVPLFAAATQGATPAARRLTAIYISVFAFVFLSFFYLTGLSLLRFFGISMAAFRIAGGILLLFMGLNMARGESNSAFADPGEATDNLSTRAYAARRFEGLVVPFGMPLLIGPGAISSAIIYAEEAHRLGVGGVAVGVGVIAVEAMVVVAAFWLSSVISRVLGKVGMIIIVRVLGLILCAMAVQFMLAGVEGSTIDLIRKDTALPYQGARHSELAPGPRAPGHQGHAPLVG
jgi:multiple antibiotic resistance protein